MALELTSKNRAACSVFVNEEVHEDEEKRSYPFIPVTVIPSMK
jgi:hypothetical protein